MFDWTVRTKNRLPGRVPLRRGVRDDGLGFRRPVAILSRRDLAQRSDGEQTHVSRIAAARIELRIRRSAFAAAVAYEQRSIGCYGDPGRIPPGGYAFGQCSIANHADGILRAEADEDCSARNEQRIRRSSVPRRSGRFQLDRNAGSALVRMQIHNSDAVVIAFGHIEPTSITRERQCRRIQTDGNACRYHMRCNIDHRDLARLTHRCIERLAVRRKDEIGRMSADVHVHRGRRSVQRCEYHRTGVVAERKTGFVRREGDRNGQCGRTGSDLPNRRICNVDVEQRVRARSGDQHVACIEPDGLSERIFEPNLCAFTEIRRIEDVQRRRRNARFY